MADINENDFNRMTTAGDVDGLILAAKNPDGEIRAHAATALSMTADPRALEPLIQLLRDPDAKVMGCAIAGLVLLGKSAEKRLTRALKDRDEDIRMGAWMALQEIKKRKQSAC